MNYLIRIHIYHDAAQVINNGGQSLIADSHPVGDIKVKITVQHGDRLCGTALCICSVTLIVAVVSEV